MIDRIDHNRHELPATSRRPPPGTSAQLGFKREDLLQSGARSRASELRSSSGDKKIQPASDRAPPAGLRPRSTRRGRSIFASSPKAASNR